MERTAQIYIRASMIVTYKKGRKTEKYQCHEIKTLSIAPKDRLQLLYTHKGEIQCGISVKRSDIISITVQADVGESL